MILLAALSLHHKDIHDLPLLPWPSQVEAREGSFKLDDLTTIVAKGREAKENADFLRQTTKLALKSAGKAGENSIVLRIVKPGCDDRQGRISAYGRQI